MEIILTDEQRTLLTNFNETVRRTGGFNGDTSAVLGAVVGVLLAADTGLETVQPVEIAEDRPETVQPESDTE